MVPCEVGECTIYKKGDNFFIDNDTISEIELGQTEFTVKPIIDSQSHLGRDICFKVLNGEIKL